MPRPISFWDELGSPELHVTGMNVDLKALKAEIGRELQMLDERENTLRTQLDCLQSIRSFLEDNQEIGERCLLSPDQVRFGDGEARSKGKSSGIRICPRCEIKVLPTKDGRCPSCQTEFPRQQNF